MRQQILFEAEVLYFVLGSLLHFFSLGLMVNLTYEP